MEKNISKTTSYVFVICHSFHMKAGMFEHKTSVYQTSIYTNTFKVNYAFYFSQKCSTMVFSVRGLIFSSLV